MIIECKTCHARFRLDESKIKGKGARVKCRKCGEQIVVLKEAPPGPPAGAAEGEGSLDLGSALREAPPDNLIRFPKTAARPAAPQESSGKDEVDLAFEALLKGAPEGAEPGPPEAPPAEPSFQAPPEEPKFELPEEPKFELPEEPKFELPEEPKFELPEEPRFEPPREFTFETQEESASQAPPEEPGFGLPEEPKAELPEEPKFEPPREITFETQAESAFPAPSEEPKFELPEEPKFELPEEPKFEAAEPTAFGEGALDLASEAKDELPTLKEEERAAAFGRDADISPAIASRPVEMEPELPIEATSFQAPAEAPPAAASEESFVEGNETPPAAVPGIGRQAIPEEEPERISVAQAPPEPPARRAAAPSGSRSLWVAVAALLLALLGAVGYFGFTDPGKQFASSLSPRLAALLGGGAPGKPVSRFEVKNVIGYFDSGAASPRILVIKGQVTNLAPAGKSGIRIFASLLDNTGNVMMEQAVYAGNVLPGAKLKTESRATLEKALVNPLGEHLMNMDVPSGKTIPFMVLFFDAPENIDSYKIEAKDNQ